MRRRAVINAGTDCIADTETSGGESGERVQHCAKVHALLGYSADERGGQAKRRNTHLEHGRAHSVQDSSARHGDDSAARFDEAGNVLQIVVHEHDCGTLRGKVGGPNADADIRLGQRGRVVAAIAHHHDHVTLSLQGGDAVRLFMRPARLDSILRNAESGSHSLEVAAAIPTQHVHRDPKSRFEARHECRSRRPHGVRERDAARGDLVAVALRRDAKEGVDARDGGGLGRVGGCAARARAVGVVAKAEGVGSDSHVVPVHHRGHPAAVVDDQIGGREEWHGWPVLVLVVPRDRRGERVRAEGLRAGDELQRARDVHAGRALQELDRGDRGLALRDRARLVQHHRGGAGQGLEGGAGLDGGPQAAAGHAHARQHRDGHADGGRAWRGRHEHGQHRVPELAIRAGAALRDQARDGRRAERDRREDRGEALAAELQRRLGLQRLGELGLHEREHGLVVGPGRHQPEGIALVARAREDGLAQPARGRQALAGEQALVHQHARAARAPRLAACRRRGRGGGGGGGGTRAAQGGARGSCHSYRGAERAA
mmetsp:Transcript_14852/g.47283  ORF Transcript_14852/g.47283 Transcript_14852/m.47283 type:complete len:543 (+) Transcript_14852:451-2079(+)